MTSHSEALPQAVVEQLNAEIAAAGTTIKALSAKLDLPYDSTRDYLREKDPSLIKLGLILRLCDGLGIDPLTLMSRARERMLK